MTRGMTWLTLSVLALAGLVAANSTTSVQEKERKVVKMAVSDFYGALNKMFAGDVEPMKDVWSHADDVIYMGPDGEYMIGWPQVFSSWEGQALMKLGGMVRPRGVRIVAGPEIAIAYCIEEGQNKDADGNLVKINIRATNVFRKEKGEWKMIGHHTDTLDFLKK